MRVAICGAICSGKTSLADTLVEKYGFKRFSFASSVKEYAKDLFNMKGKNRQLLQDLAEKLKEIDQDVWVNRLDREINKIITTDTETNIVIDDLRFPNELEYLKRNGFFIIRINIEKIDQLRRLRNVYPDDWMEHEERLTHCSELGRTTFIVDLDILANDEGFQKAMDTIDNNPLRHPGLC